MKYIILIPAYNAADTLPVLIDQIGRLPELPEKIVVVDDGSSDGTGVVAAEKHMVDVIRLDPNRGKGQALRTGFERIMNKYTAEYILCMDADLQHPASAVPDFLACGLRRNSKFVIGNRSKKPGAMPLHRVLSNKMTSWIISGLTGQQVPDSQCGYRLIHREVLDGMQLRENGFQLESEMIMQAARKGYRVDSVDIPTIYGHHGSHISNVRDTFGFIRLVVREFFGR